MKFSKFFIDRPIFAAVLSSSSSSSARVALSRAAGRAISRHRAADGNVSAAYPGASAEVLAETVATPLEQQINGVEHMLYISRIRPATARSRSPSPSSWARTSTPRRCWCRTAFPSPSRACRTTSSNIGVTVAKASPDLMMVVHLLSPDNSRNQPVHLQLRQHQCRGRAGRVEGVGDRSPFSARATIPCASGSIRQRLQSRGLTAGDVVAALQRAERAGGGRRDQPAADATSRSFQISVQTLGRLSQPESSATSSSRPTRRRRGAAAGCRAGRTGRARLRHQRLSRQDARRRPRHLPAARLQRAGHRPARAQNHGGAVKKFPGGSGLRIIYDPTEFIQQSQDAVIHTLFMAIVPGRAGGDPVSAELARGGHPHRRHPGLADRHVLPDEACSASR